MKLWNEVLKRGRLTESINRKNNKETWRYVFMNYMIFSVKSVVFWIAFLDHSKKNSHTVFSLEFALIFGSCVYVSVVIWTAFGENNAICIFRAVPITTAGFRVSCQNLVFIWSAIIRVFKIKIYILFAALL